MRQSRTRRATTEKPAQNAGNPANAVSSEGVKASTNSESQRPQYEWVAVEHRDSDGNPTLPRKLIASTYLRRYGDVPPGTEIKVHVLAGYKPTPLLMVERKIYEVHRLSIRGWRRSGQIALEVEDWRRYEVEWFNAMRGAKLVISDPGLPGPHNEDSEYVISASSFGRKIVKSPDEQGNQAEVRLHEGTLDITETWVSAWRRQRAEVLNMGLKLLLLPLFAALGAGLALLLVDRSPRVGSDSETWEVPVQQADQPANSGQGSDPSDEAVIAEAPDASASQTENTEQEPGDHAPEDPVAAEEPSS